MKMEYNIEDFDIKIIEIKSYMDNSTDRKRFEAKISINDYEIRCNYNIQTEEWITLKYHYRNSSIETYITDMLKNEAFRFYISDKLLMRKEKIKKLKNKIWEETTSWRNYKTVKPF